MKVSALRSAAAIAACLAALGASAPASATSFLLRYSAGSTPAYAAGATAVKAMLTTSDTADANGYYQVTSILGTYGVDPISLLPAGSYPSDVPGDNLVKAAGQYVTNQGISFVAGGSNYNLWFDDLTSSFQQCYEDGAGSCSTTDVTGLSVEQIAAAVPEPASWAMMTVGMAALGMMLRRRRSIATSAAQPV